MTSAGHTGPGRFQEGRYTPCAPRMDDEVQTAFVPVAVPQERPVTWRQHAVSATLIVLTLAAIASLAW